MLPDSQKGFAPTIRGIARTNAQVTVRQNGYVLYQTYVTPGAFVIDDLYPTASSGNLEVAVKESDGEIRRFTQPYASVTSMQREGSLKYNLVAGRYHSDDASQRPLMMQLSLMRGFAQNLTLFGGLQSAAQYHNLSLGAGQGLGEAGALSLQLLNARDRHQQDPIDGRAWQLQYSKGFDRLGTQLTFTGWRYSHQRYATLSEAFSSPGSDDDLQDSDNKKATLQITASQSLPYDITLYLSLDQDSYWSGGATQRTANMGISSQVNGIAWSLSYSDSRSSHGDEEDDEPHSDKVVTLSLSVPLSHLLPGSYAGYTLTSSRHSVGSQMVSLNGTLLDNHALSYAVSQTRDRQNGSSGSLTAGYSSGRGDLNLGYSHDSQAARLNYGASGGILIHRHGVVFTPEMNGAVVLIDAGGAGDVTLANQKTIATNGDGYAVLPFATAYHRNDVSLDSHSLPENVDLANSTVTLVPTKDAVVLARFHTHVGYKALFTLQSRGQPLPFGSEVRVKDTSSIVASEGQVYLAGLAPKGTCMRNGGRALSSAVAPATISPRRWRRPPIHSFYSRRYHVLFNSPASVAMTLLFILLPAASGWACTPVFVRGQASTLRLNVGQLTVPADARPGTPLYHKSSPGTALATAANSGSLRGRSARAVTAAAGQSAVRGSDATDGLSN